MMGDPLIYKPYTEHALRSWTKEGIRGALRSMRWMTDYDGQEEIYAHLSHTRANESIGYSCRCLIKFQHITNSIVEGRGRRPYCFLKFSIHSKISVVET